jgi:hypothetical protein
MQFRVRQHHFLSQTFRVMPTPGFELNHLVIQGLTVIPPGALSFAGIGPIESSDIVKGCQVEPDVYVTMEPEEIEAIKLESKKTIDMVQFVDAEQIDPRFPRPTSPSPAMSSI